jgi:hypothetical protein
MLSFIGRTARYARGVLIVYVHFAFAGVAQVQGATVDFEIRALTGDAAPGAGPGVTFSDFDAAALNAAGNLAFRATVLGSGVDLANNVGIWSHRGGALDLVVRTGDAAPGTSAEIQYSSIGAPRLDATGHTAFHAHLAGDSIVRFTNDEGLWSESGGSLHLMARTGNVAPGAGGGAYNDFSSLPTSPGPDSTDVFVLNAAGQMAFRASLVGGGVTPFNNSGIWSEDGGALGLVAREGEAAPRTPGDSFGSFVLAGGPEPVINAAGQTAFWGNIDGDAADAGIWVKGGGAERLVARSGEEAPGTGPDVQYLTFGSPIRINNSGQVAYLGSVTGDGVGSANNTGVWSETSGSPRLVAREGEAAPGAGPNVFLDFSVPVGLLFNGAGHTAFAAALTGPGTNADNNSGLWSDRGGSLDLVMREGDSAPGANAVFSSLSDVELNDAGQLAFTASLAGPGVNFQNDSALWISDLDGGVTLVAREGDLFDVNDHPLIEDLRTISYIEMSGAPLGSGAAGSGGQDGNRSAFNEAGQLALLVGFTDGSEAIVVATLVPEPITGAALVILAAVATARGRRRTPLRFMTRSLAL